MSLPKTSTFYLAVALGTLALLWPALWNGYPLLNPDNNTYLLSGFLPETPFDRPITYGLLLRAGSLNGLSLWTAVTLQCWCVSWLLVRTQLRVQPSRAASLWQICAVPVALAVCSSVAWVSSELIPDISTAIAFLCLFLIVLNRESRAGRVLLYVLFTAQVATHFSNVMILVLVIAVMAIFRKRIATLIGRRSIRGSLGLAALLALATISIMGSALSKSKHVFFMGAMLEQGILQTYLDEHCPTDSLSLCAYRPSLRKDANWFLWEAESPLYKTGGWAANKPEYTRIINATLTEPRYIALHIRESLRFTGRQILSIGVGDGNTPFRAETELHHTIHQYLHDAPLFDRARQQDGTLLFITPALDLLYKATALLSLAFIVFVIAARRRNIPAALRFLVVLSALLILVNDWNCATFAQVNGRYGCRVTWLLAYAALLLVPYVRTQKLAADAAKV